MEAINPADEYQIISLPIENSRFNDVNNQFNHPGMRNSPDYDDQDEDLNSDSDCESEISDPNPNELQTCIDDLVELYEGDRIYEIVKRQFLAGLGDKGIDTYIVSICRNCFSSYMGRAKVQSFKLFAKAMDKKCRGDSNLKFAWFGGSKDEILKIISDGFDGYTNELYGPGVYLATYNLSLDSVKSSIADENGLKHVLLCRVIMGKFDQVVAGSQQSDTSPNKYIVSSRHMNTHILPEFMISFRAHPHSEDRRRVQAPIRYPNSPWMPFRVLISALAKLLPHGYVRRISKHYDDHKEMKISRHELILRIRAIAGDKLLISVIKSYRNKQVNKFRDSSSTSISNKWSGGYTE